MTYPSWASLYEGSTDEAYFEIIIPRLMEDLVARTGTRNVHIPLTAAVRLGKNGRGVAQVAAEACAEQDAFYILFIHADTGGRALEAGVADRSVAFCEAAHALCDFPPDRCVVVTPRHETEAWILADPEAVGGALGFRGSPAELGLPANAPEAERLRDPKAVLKEAISQVRGRRSSQNVGQLIPAIAQRQSIAALQRSASFQAFEARFATALRSLGCIA